MTNPDATDDHEAATAASLPGTVAPARQWHLEVAPGLHIAVHEWGDADAPPLFLAHGGADFARTFDRFAPRLAAGGWRVVAWDHRGHGDSGRAAMYSWRADLRDALSVIRAVAPSAPVPLVGHSKGGGLYSHLAAAYPERFSHFVNIDGIPRRALPSSNASERERLERRDQMFSRWLDHWRKVGTRERRPGTIAELAERRGRMNPRLSEEWLRYLATVGGRQAEDGWRWKLDPAVRMGPGHGPWRPDWGLRGLRDIRVPMLAILGRVKEPMGWGNDPDEAREDIPEGAELETYADSGHFVHIEHPERTAARVLEFVGEPPRGVRGEAPGGVREWSSPAPSRAPEGALRLRCGRVDFALRRLREAAPEAGGTRALLVLPALGETVDDLIADDWADSLAWRGPVWALEWPGHGHSGRAEGGGYTSEALLCFVDRALEHLGGATVLGRGIGAYVALQIQGARPRLAHGAVLSPGNGLGAGGSEPGTLQQIGSVESELELIGTVDGKGIDPLALQELAREVRPSGYARLFLRQARGLSGLDSPVLLDAALTEGDDTPPWLATVRDGGSDITRALDDALAHHEAAPRSEPAA